MLSRQSAWQTKNSATQDYLMNFEMLAVYLPSFLVKKCINIKFHIRTFELFSNRQIIEHHSFENLKIYKVGSE